MSIIRMQKQLADLTTYFPSDFHVKLYQQYDIFALSAKIFGPEGTLYQKGTFNLKIQIPAEYPFRPPIVTFLTQVYHPNIDVNGRVSLDILRDMWSPGLTIGKVLLSVTSLLDDPNFDDPVYVEVAEVWRRDREEFGKNAREWTHKYARE